MAVSYTHLDVYKRQEAGTEVTRSLADDIQNAAVPYVWIQTETRNVKVLSSMMVDLRAYVAVSYTHLDVYKRQELSVLELNDLVKACEEEFGVSAAAGVVVAAAGAGAAAAEEKTEFDVELTEDVYKRQALYVGV